MPGAEEVALLMQLEEPVVQAVVVMELHLVVRLVHLEQQTPAEVEVEGHLRQLRPVATVVQA
jgi:hypothetical protein